MQTNDDINTDLIDQNTLLDEKKAKNRDDWLNEHGQPSYDYLQSLVSKCSPESLEKLRSIATDLDVEFGPNTSPEILAELISSSTKGDAPQTIS
jgi:hypothetical protein